MDRVLSDGVCSQLDLIEQSQELIRIILGGIALQYHALDVQRDLLLDQALHPGDFRPDCHPDPIQIRLGASLMVLYALLGFQNQSQELALQACEAGEDADLVEPLLSAIILIVALIRLVRLLPACASSTDEQAQTDRLT